MIDRSRAGKLALLFVFLCTAGVLWATSGQYRMQTVQTTTRSNASPGLDGNSSVQINGAGYANSSPAVGMNNAQPIAADAATQSGRVEVMVPSTTLFDEYRLERDRSRASQIELLRATLNDKTLSESRRDQLTADLFSLLKRGEKELQAETLLKAKGYSDAVVVMNESGANVVVPQVLERTDAAQVGELVSRAAEVDVAQITIIDGAGR